MKIFAIVGAGAVGSYYGARLAEAGNEVRFLLRSDYEVVREGGLEIESIHGDFKVPEVICARSAEEIGKVDVVIVAWKTTANERYEEVIGPMLHDDSVVLTLQNGLGNVEQLAEIFGENRVLGGLCFVCINRMRAGLIWHSGGGKISIGGLKPGVTPRLTKLAEIFKEAKIPCETVANLGEAQWRKLVWNIPFNGLCITEGGIDTEVLLAQPDGESRVRELMMEVISAAGALGYEIEEGFIDYQIEITCSMGGYRPSSMIDFVEGNPIEIEAIWGEPLRRAQAAGVAVPKITQLYRDLTQ